MNIGLSRRALVRASFFGLITMAAPVIAAAPLRIPAGPMALTRRLERQLSDGKAIIVTRQWQVEFARLARSITVIGKQFACEVEAPKQLSQLAAIEKARIAEGMFPIALSDTGQIMTASRGDQSASIEQAVLVAKSMIEKAALTASDKATAKRHLMQMQRASASLFEKLPKDLFFPSKMPLRTMRPVKLPDGQIGEFELTYSAQSAQHANWLGRAERRIITRLGDSERRSSEIWSLDEMTDNRL